MDTTKLIKMVGAEYLRSFQRWEELDGNILEEEYEDTIQRKYQEGYSDGLAMVLDLLEANR